MCVPVWALIETRVRFASSPSAMLFVPSILTWGSHGPGPMPARPGTETSIPSANRAITLAESVLRRRAHPPALGTRLHRRARGARDPQHPHRLQPKTQLLTSLARPDVV